MTSIFELIRSIVIDELILSLTISFLLFKINEDDHCCVCYSWLTRIRNIRIDSFDQFEALRLKLVNPALSWLRCISHNFVPSIQNQRRWSLLCLLLSIVTFITHYTGKSIAIFLQPSSRSMSGLIRIRQYSNWFFRLVIDSRRTNQFEASPPEIGQSCIVVTQVHLSQFRSFYSKSTKMIIAVFVTFNRHIHHSLYR